MFLSAGCASVALVWGVVMAGDPQLILNPNFHERNAGGPVGYALSGDVSYQYLGDPRKDSSGWGVALHGGRTESAGEVSQALRIPDGARRAYRFTFRGLAQNGFSVVGDGRLWMRVDFLGEDDAKNYDGKSRQLYPAIQLARRKISGAPGWQTYSMEFVVPFVQVKRLKLSVEFERGHGEGIAADFYVSDFNLTAIPVPAIEEKSEEAVGHRELTSLDHLLRIGARWSYAARPDETRVPDVFNAGNSDRLLYFDGQYEAPFAGNMNSVLRKGEMDRSGQIAEHDTPIPDNVAVRFDAKSMIIHTRGLPNHPTGMFPLSGMGAGSNPNYIIEQDATYYLPLEPKDAKATRSPFGVIPITH